jgi:hypothetical protein
MSGALTLIAPIVVADVDLDGCALTVSLVQHQAQLPQDLELTFNTGIVVTMPIRFSPMTTTFRMLPIARIQAGIGGGLVAAREPKQAAEAVERVVAAVEAEGELVEVGLKVLGADAVVRAPQPGLQVREDHVDHRQVVLGDLGVIVLGAGQVLETALVELA